MSNRPISNTLRRLLVAQVPADFADWLDFVAVGALLAYVWSVDPFVFAILAVSMGLLIWFPPQKIFAINALVLIVAAALLWRLPVIARIIGLLSLSLSVQVLRR